MRILVTGSRNWKWQDRQYIVDALVKAAGGRSDVLVIHGAAPGADSLAAWFATSRGWKTDPNPADWTGPCADDCDHGGRRRRRDGTEYCPQAGNRRNGAMVAKGADVCVAFPGSDSRGTWNCVTAAKKAGIPVTVVTKKAAS